MVESPLHFQGNRIWVIYGVIFSILLNFLASNMSKSKLQKVQLIVLSEDLLKKSEVFSIKTRRCKGVRELWQLPPNILREIIANRVNLDSLSINHISLLESNFKSAREISFCSMYYHVINNSLMEGLAYWGHQFFIIVREEIHGSGGIWIKWSIILL